MNLRLLFGLAALIAGFAYASPFDPECERRGDGLNYDACESPIDPVIDVPPPILPTDSDTPPTITPPGQLMTSGAVLYELETVVDWYVVQVYEEQGTSGISLDDLNQQFLAFAINERSSRPDYFSGLPTAYTLLNVKLRVLVANHPDFASGVSLPNDIAGLLFRLSQLEILEGGLKEVSP